MKITLSDLRWTMLAVNKPLNKKEYEQFGYKIKKYLMRNYSILSEVEVK